jgi:predicted aldo/keto reductase-like oxidoreductase
MRKVTLKRTGLNVSRIGFGGLPIQRIDEKDAVAVIRRCLDLGINLIDTANGYTVSEGYIGKAISTYPRDSIILATKTRARDYKTAMDHIKLSLERLGTDYIDIYMLHNVSDLPVLDQVLAKDGALSALEEAKKAGIIRHIGVSSHGHQTALAAAKLDCFETMMYPYNFVAHEPGEEVLQACRDNNIDFFAMKPLGGGRLDNAKLAFKFLLNIPDVVPFVGIEKPEEIEEIVGIEKNLTPLNKEEQAEIKRIVDEIGNRFCRRCRYCLPCPEGIIIPLLNNLVTFLRHDSAEQCFGPGIVSKTVDMARGCTECGECEERCPYDLPIIEMNKDNVKLYDDAKAKYERGLK